ncbi:hypothetical protein [Azorhizophilus paspali]|uniref:Uncharacterized protein n=1 Tax=Azorhizophilus paspali TaxID=69963 RepID=A0ABV6SFX7_AZOPA
MARTVTPLMDPKCEAAKPREKDYKLFDGQGFYLWCLSRQMIPFAFLMMSTAAMVEWSLGISEDAAAFIQYAASMIGMSVELRFSS